MKVLQADFYDGITSQRHEVSLVIGGGKLKIVGRDVGREVELFGVRRSLRIADTPRWLYLPGGGACVTLDNEAVDHLTRDRRYERLLHHWESRPIYAMLAVAMVAFTAWLLIDRALPAAVEQIAEQIPIEVETILGEETLQGLDRFATGPSTLDAARLSALRQKFDVMMYSARDFTPRKLEFRSSRVLGANAFALPAGIIVVTDDLVRLAKKDQEVLAVLAHEVGHINHRHAMRRLLETSVTAMIIAGLTGDLGSASSLAAAAPAVLVKAKHSRANEREADAYAVDLLRRARLSPRHLGTILSRLGNGAKGSRNGPSFLSTHPSSTERVALAVAAAEQLAEEDRKADAANESAQAAAESTRRVVLDPVQRQVIALFEAGNYADLDRLLGSYLEVFERDPATSGALENAFLAFGRLPASAQSGLDAWHDKVPVSYGATVGRAIFHIAQGRLARGGETKAKTPSENLRAMQAHMDMARADLEQSMSMTGKPYLSRRYLIVVSRYAGPSGSGGTHYAEATKLAPQSVEVRLERMTDLEPRWGGSYAAMEALVSASRAEMKDPAMVARIAARVPDYRAFESQRKRQYAEALRFYDDALRLEESAYTLCARSYVLAEMQRYEAALEDVKRGLSKRRDEEYCLERGVWAALRSHDWPEVVAVTTLVLEVDPAAVLALTQRGWALRELGKHELAFQDYLKAANLGDAYAQLNVGRFYLNGIGTKQDREQTTVWFRRAAVQGEPDAYRLLDGLLQERAAQK